MEKVELGKTYEICSPHVDIIKNCFYIVTDSEEMVEKVRAYIEIPRYEVRDITELIEQK